MGSFEAYNTKFDDWSNYKGRLGFYFQTKKIPDATMKRAGLFTLIGNNLSVVTFSLKSGPATNVAGLDIKR